MLRLRRVPLLTPYTMGKFKLSHGIVLAPLSRLRSYNNIRQSHAILYYSQRTSNGGFLLAEATEFSWHPDTPVYGQRSKLKHGNPLTLPFIRRQYLLLSDLEL